MQSYVIKPEIGYFSTPQQCCVDSAGTAILKLNWCFLTNDMALEITKKMLRMYHEKRGDYLNF